MNLKIEKTLFDAADKMRGSMDAGEYKHVALTDARHWDALLRDGTIAFHVDSQERLRHEAAYQQDALPFRELRARVESHPRRGDRRGASNERLLRLGRRG